MGFWNLNKNSRSRLSEIYFSHCLHQIYTVPICRALLEHPDVDYNLADNKSTTPLNWASFHGYSEIVSILLKKPGIDLNRQDSHGGTALFYASKNGHEEVKKRETTLMFLILLDNCLCWRLLVCLLKCLALMWTVLTSLAKLLSIMPPSGDTLRLQRCWLKGERGKQIARELNVYKL